MYIRCALALPISQLDGAHALHFIDFIQCLQMSPHFLCLEIQGKTTILWEKRGKCFIHCWNKCSPLHQPLLFKTEMFLSSSYNPSLWVPCFHQELVELISLNRVLVVSGETGCGKTTQVTQFILDDYINRGLGSMCRVVCTQPRRISAISVCLLLCLLSLSAGLYVAAVCILRIYGMWLLRYCIVPLLN